MLMHFKLNAGTAGAYRIRTGGLDYIDPDL
jgi:hypothetical protein